MMWRGLKERQEAPRLPGQGVIRVSAARSGSASKSRDSAMLRVRRVPDGGLV